jgi:hypothetical protein
MSTQTWGTVLNIVRKKLQDEGDVINSDAELLRLGNEAMRWIISLIPEAYTIYKTVELISGARQALPSDCIGPPEGIDNQGTDGATPGDAVSTISYSVLQALVPDYNTATSSATTDHVIPVPGNPTEFFVYPPSNGTGHIRIKTPATPPLVSYDAGGLWQVEVVPLDDKYVVAIPDTICMFAVDDDTDIPGNTMQAQKYYQRVMTMLGLVNDRVSVQK